MSDNVDNFQLRYVGQRFDGARLPVDVLSDLPAFRDLIAAFARSKWMHNFPERSRLPKGFDRSLSFDLTRIDEGSAIPNLSWSRDIPQGIFPGFEDQLEATVASSFADIVQLIDQADQPSSVIALNSAQIRALNKLGSGLRKDERIEFLNTTGADGNVIYLDSFRRKRLITRVRNSYQTRLDDIGVLTTARADESSSYIVVATNQHGDITIPLDRETVVEDYAPYLTSEIQFDLQIELDHNDQFKSLVEIHDLALIDEEISADLVRCRERIAYLVSPAAEWRCESDVAISNLAQQNAERFLVKRAGLVKLLKIFPNESGGLLFEFEISGWDLTVEFLQHGGVEMYGIEIDGLDELKPLEFRTMDMIFFQTLDARIGTIS